jgi:myo-inositol-1(or 4)-monophosphatase
MIKTSDIKTVLSGASEIILKYFRQETEVNYKLDESPVTVADYAANEFLKNGLLKLLPEAGWLSEEEKDNRQRLTQEYVWIVDPLDGTKEFVARVPEIAVSVALVKDNVPVLGGVMNPVTGEGGICSAWEGSHFFGFARKTENAPALEIASTIVSRTEYGKGKIKPFENRLKNIRPVGSVAYKLLRIAGGLDHFYFSVEPKSEWDICGGIALLTATGKEYRRFDAKENRFNLEDTTIFSGAAAGGRDLLEQFFSIFPETKKSN